MSGERKESCYDRKQSLVRYTEQIRGRERERERESCSEDKWYWICDMFHI